MSLHTSTKVVVYIGGHLCLFSVTAAAKHFFQLFRTNLHFSSSLTTDESLWALSEQGLAPVSSFYVFADQFGGVSHPPTRASSTRSIERRCTGLFVAAQQAAGGGWSPPNFHEFFSYFVAKHIEKMTRQSRYFWNVIGMLRCSRDCS